MRIAPRSIFLLEAGLAVVSAALALLSTVWPDWIEALFEVEPDGHDGSVEWMIVAGFAVFAVACVGLARSQWRRVRVSVTA